MRGARVGKAGRARGQATGRSRMGARWVGQLTVVEIRADMPFDGCGEHRSGRAGGALHSRFQMGPMGQRDSQGSRAYPQRVATGPPLSLQGTGHRWEAPDPPAVATVAARGPAPAKAPCPLRGTWPRARSPRRWCDRFGCSAGVEPKSRAPRRGHGFAVPGRERTRAWSRCIRRESRPTGARVRGRFTWSMRPWATRLSIRLPFLHSGVIWLCRSDEAFSALNASFFDHAALHRRLMTTAWMGPRLIVMPAARPIRVRSAGFRSP